MPVIRIGPKHQVTIPKEVFDQLHIQTDLLRSQGLTKEEIKVACRVGLIDPDQAWWWAEEWQKGEREAEKDIKKGRLYSPFGSVKEFKESLVADDRI